MSYVFVYGTLMRGFVNHFLLEPYIVSIKPATILGKIRHLVEGYPMLFKGDGVVYGELVELTNEQQALAELDALEEYYGAGNVSNYYERCSKIVKDSSGREFRAWVYLCPDARIDEISGQSNAIPDGDWRKFILSRK
ncbi:gamma-glutamylcyclotransferase family protein [Dendrosporobacter sp. 1207_IL3150]|uniref:gamma-glutamylcyclotransferase family protein n=1 Tax=Dendrosporobacter sp. 1207_IL3150 TaxID=3084054 RepID=UPI002FDA7F25